MEVTDSFFSLQPDSILNSVQLIGKRPTGRCLALNSLENRVYEIEMEDNSKLVAKFYRPQRWSKESILDEHQFLYDLAEAEVPVVAPIRFPDGSSLMSSHDGIWFALFPKVAGRVPDEMNPDQLRQVGRFLGRLHGVGKSKESKHRLRISADSYGRKSIEFLKNQKIIAPEVSTRYCETAMEIIEKIEKPLSQLATHRIHGDCHLGNLLWNKDGPFFLDFDDMLMGPPVQDIWLLTPGRDEMTNQNRQYLVEGYNQMNQFDSSTLSFVEPLRALRIIHYSAWIAKRWTDPSFPRTFPDFLSYKYWASELEDLLLIRNHITTQSHGI